MQVEYKMQVKQLIIISLLLTLVYSKCSAQCQTCLSQSKYSCLSCPVQPYKNLYIKSCQVNESSTLFFTMSIILVIIHLVMIGLGYGMYRNIYQNIQLLSLISWGYGSENGVNQLQITNLAIPSNNSFMLTMGPQFFIVLIFYVLFFLITAAVDKLPHNTIGTLLKRKKIIFPFRIETIFWNITLFSTLSDVCTLNSSRRLDMFSFVFAIIVLIKQVIILAVFGWIINGSQFEIDDPKYYVLVEKLTSKRWYSRNYSLFALIVRALIIIIFITLYQSPQIAGLAIGIIMLSYTIVSIFCLRYTKARFGILNFFSNCFTTACFFLLPTLSTSSLSSLSYKECLQSYYILTICICCLLFISYLIQIVINSNPIVRQIKSIYFRFLICKKMDDQVQLNRYDDDKNRQRVTTFRKNLIFKQELAQYQQQNQII